MNIHTVLPVVLCGGFGTRLWPLSRGGFPKQFLVLSGTTSLFQQAFERVNQLGAPDITVGQTLVVTNEQHRFIIQEQLREIKAVNVTLLLESTGRNTAPGLTLAALQATEDGQDPILVVTPADQAVQNPLEFQRALRQCIRVAADGSIVILGITPDKPKTGYGYIKQSGTAGAHGEYNVVHFVEKPTLEEAKSYFMDGQYTWNSGIFVLRASTWLNALQHYRPDIAVATKKAWISKSQDESFVRPNKEAFSQVPSESVDYAVIDKCPGSSYPISMVPLNAGWSDLGEWDAVWQFNQDGHQDADGNVVLGDAVLADTANTLIHASSRLVGVVGVSNLIVVETADSVLVADRFLSQNVKKLVQQLEANNHKEISFHRKVHRPWGWFDSLDEGDRFKVKRINVKPGASLSLQKHHFRAEHWIVVKGIAQVTNGDQNITLLENQSTYIPLGEIHRLSNPGNILLEIIEVQTGSYLEEDDIIRFEDTYGRKTIDDNFS